MYESVKELTGESRLRTGEALMKTNAKMPMEKQGLDRGKEYIQELL